MGRGRAAQRQAGMIHAFASRAHYVDHLAPVWHALPPDLRGSFLASGPAALAAGRLGISAAPIPPRAPVTRLYSADVALVSGGQDLYHARRLGFRRMIRMEHGIGQSYVGLYHPSYAGGSGHHDVVLFLTPNDHSAARWRAVYPAARVEAIGSPFVETLPPLDRVSAHEVMLTFRWDTSLVPELRSALPHYRAGLADLARRFPLIGHGHPRALPDLEPLWRQLGIPVVHDYREALARAAVVVGDNTSALYEAAATGRRVVVLDAPWYRPGVLHGLRFWDAADVDLRVSDPAQLPDALAFGQRPTAAREYARRDKALALVYAHATGSALRAADAIRGLVE